MALEHTPGPWFAKREGNDYRVFSYDYGTIVLRNCYPNPKIDTSVEGDAKLIAAAPELLKACKMVLKNGSACLSNDELSKIEIAISAAKEAD